MPPGDLVLSPIQRNVSKECRLCFESKGEDFIAPCRCSGTSRWVHRGCLDRWRACGTHRTAFTTCGVCSFAYSLQLVREEYDESQIRHRQRRLVRKLVSKLCLITVLTQVLLVAAAVLIRILDTGGVFLKLFNFPEQPAWFGRSPLWIVTYHMNTYYLASLLCCGMSVSLLFLLVIWLASCGFPICRNSAAFNDSVQFVQSFCTGCCDGPSAAAQSMNSWTCCVVCAMDGEMALIALAVAIAAVLVFAVFVVFAAILMGLQRAVGKVLEVRELRVLASEYIVEDLAECQPPVNFSEQEAFAGVLETTGDLAAPDQEAMDLEAGAVPRTSSAVQESLAKDLHALRGE